MLSPPALIHGDRAVAAQQVADDLARAPERPGAVIPGHAAPSGLSPTYPELIAIVKE